MNSAHISLSDKKLLAHINRIGFGSIENLELRDGIAVTIPTSREVQSFKQEGGNVAGRVAGDNPFTLKDCQADFLNQLHAVGNGFIRSIVIQDGLPIRFEIEKALNAI
ncbi:MAG: hypothetical protein ACOX6W_16660 [Lentisphaeria bacterium]|jgi:hypothetical protein